MSEGNRVERRRVSEGNGGRGGGRWKVSEGNGVGERRRAMEGE